MINSKILPENIESNISTTTVESEATSTTTTTTLSAENDDKKMKEEDGVYFWIGLKTRAEMSTPHAQFLNFYDEEKLDGCTVIDRKGKWKIRPCSKMFGFVCQRVTVR